MTKQQLRCCSHCSEPLLPGDWVLHFDDVLIHEECFWAWARLHRHWRELTPEEALFPLSSPVSAE